MKIGFEVFLVVAREMSITKAANELHITQQCASDHIKRLEKEYNVVLFASQIPSDAGWRDHAS